MSLVATLQQCPESFPQWLQQPSPTFDRASFFGSRNVFYPGSGDDGQPVSVCAPAHAAHTFIYIDYGVSQRTPEGHLHGMEGQGLRGYRIEREQPVAECVLRPGGWTTHVDLERLHKGADRFAKVPPFALCSWSSRAMRTMPYGSVARMLLAWVYAEAGRTGDGRRLAGLLCTPPRVDAPCATALSACEGRQR